MRRVVILLSALALGCAQPAGVDPTDPVEVTDPPVRPTSPTEPTDPTDPLPPECTDQTVDEVFERYVEPLVTGGQPSSCNQCHLSGLDLSLFVQDTPCQSMACMVDQGIVDLDDPASSEVLAWIQRAEPESELITETVIQREYDAFLAWIEWSATCHDAVCGEIVDPCNSGTGSDAGDPVQTPLGDCSEADLGARFETDVYVHRDRCAGCHSYGAPYNQGGLAPEWLDPGEDWNAVLATMYNAIGRGYLDETSPEASLLILKPLDEAVGGVPHGGGTKIDEWGSATAQGFLAFAEYWASCQ